MSPLLVRRTRLALRSPADFVPSAGPSAEERAAVGVERPSPMAVARYRRLYADVGSRWCWWNRREWSDARLAEWLARDDVTMLLLRMHDADAGLAELHHRGDGTTELIYFGLTEPYVGRGLGGWFLGEACAEAWRRGARTVVLDTCTLDGPAALPNYRARGFVPYRTEEYVEARRS